MKHLVNLPLKRESIAQCIVQASRPKTCLLLIPFELGVEIDKTIGSKWLITHLSRVGFCISYDKVQMFKQSAIVHANNKNEVVSVCDVFSQWIADNADHDINTLTGKGTFHGMGIICANSELISDFGKVPRLRKISSSSFIKDRGVEIIPYQKTAKSCLSNIILEPLLFKTMESQMGIFNLLWHSAWLLSTQTNPRPNWSGFMLCATIGKMMESSGLKDQFFIGYAENICATHFFWESNFKSTSCSYFSRKCLYFSSFGEYWRENRNRVIRSSKLLQKSLK